MRGIKFRAWNMSKDNYMELHGYLGNTFWDNGELCTVQATIILEQFTGLRDKNGKEIYEGDIVRGIMSAGAGMQSRPGKSCLFEVKINIGGWGYETTLHQITELKGDYRSYPNFNRVEVIGNIHENPELLEATK